MYVEAPFFRFLDLKEVLSGVWGAFVEKFPKKLKQKSSIHYLRKQKEAGLSVSGLHKYQLSLWFLAFYRFFLILIQMISSNPNLSLFIRSESGVGSALSLVDNWWRHVI